MYMSQLGIHLLWMKSFSNLNRLRVGGRQITNRTIHVCVTGKVQGVAYRAWMVRIANRLQIKGWVRNRHDGSVEALLQGSSRCVDELLEACKYGPPAAKVLAVEYKVARPCANDGLGNFRQLPNH